MRGLYGQNDVNDERLEVRALWSLRSFVTPFRHPTRSSNKGLTSGEGTCVIKEHEETLESAEVDAERVEEYRQALLGAWKKLLRSS